MKQIVTLLLAIVAAIVFYSCQKSIHEIISTGPIVPASNCRLVKITQGTPASTDPLYEDTTDHISYDQQGRIAALTDSIGNGLSIDRPAYDGNGRLVSITGEQSRLYPLHFQYNQKGLLTAIIDTSFFSINVYSYEFGSNDLPVKRTLHETSYNLADSPYTTIKNYFYNTANDIVRTIEYSSDSSLSATITEYTYVKDANINQQLNLYNLDALYGFYDIMSPDFYFNKHMTGSIQVYEKLFPATGTLTINSYAYDSLQRISSIVSTITEKSGPPNPPISIITHTRHFFYECK